MFTGDHPLSKAVLGDWREAGLTTDELASLAEEIRFIVMGNKGMTIFEYLKSCDSIPYKKFGYRKLKALHNEPKLSIFFPDEVYEILKDKGKEKKCIAFDESDNLFFKNNGCRGIDWLTKRFYSCPQTIYKRAERIGVKINPTVHFFTPEEDLFITNNFSKGCSWIAEKLHSNKHSIRNRALILGLKFQPKGHRYNAEEDAFIISNRHNGSEWLSNQLKVTVASVWKRAHKLKVGIPSIRNGKPVYRFTKEEDRIIVENKDMGAKWIADKINRRIQAIIQRSHVLKVAIKTTYHFYTEEEDNLIREYYNKDRNMLSEKIGVSLNALRKRSLFLGLGKE